MFPSVHVSQSNLDGISALPCRVNVYKKAHGHMTDAQMPFWAVRQSVTAFHLSCRECKMRSRLLSASPRRFPQQARVAQVVPTIGPLASQWAVRIPAMIAGPWTAAYCSVLPCCVHSSPQLQRRRPMDCMHLDSNHRLLVRGPLRTPQQLLNRTKRRRVSR